MPGRHSAATAVGALLALAVAAFAYVTTETLPIGLLLLITADLDVSPSTAGLLVTCYGLVVVAASIPLTHLTRRVPRRLLLSGVLAVFVVTSWVSAAASSYSMLLSARVVTALSQALFWSVVVPTAAGLFPAPSPPTPTSPRSSPRSAGSRRPRPGRCCWFGALRASSGSPPAEPWSTATHGRRCSSR